MQRPIVSVFIDGLRPDWVQKMPFVRSMGATQELVTEFGYSIACHASMYTGESIDKHGHWFVWQRDASRSPFPPLLAKFPKLLDNIPSRLLVHRLLVLRIPRSSYPRGYFGIPRIISTPIRQWPGLSVSEDRFWTEPDYAPMPTLFDRAREARIVYETVGLHHGGAHLESVEQSLSAGEKEWYFLFLGEVDHAAHSTGGKGEHFDQVLKRVDTAIRDRCEEVRNRHGSFSFFLWSDHGHLAVEKYIDIYRRVDRGILAKVPHIVDTNFARFWTRHDDEIAQLSELLSGHLPEGRVLSRSEQLKWECWFPDARYGNLIFYLDAPFAFSRTAWGLSRSQKSVHGYSPEIPEMNATFVTNVDGATPKRLREIHDVHTQAFGLTYEHG